MHSNAADDLHWMRLALAEAARAQHRTSPNPMVGAVILDAAGTLVGRGYHREAGQPHAETLAVAEAGGAAQGGTCYVTLEPCVHHGRTPPCADALMGAGLSRVVVALEDPDSRVAGHGIERLRAAGIRVDVGLGREEAAHLIRYYLVHRRLGRPYVTLKWAMTLDGHTATATGQSRWISGAAARRRTHELRHAHDAILVGIKTILADDPALNTRLDVDPPPRQPVRVVLDAGLRTPADARVITSKGGPTWLFGARDAAERADDIDVIRVGISDGMLDLEELLHVLAQRGVLSVLVEGGATVHGSFVAAGLVDEVVAFVAPRIVGGGNAPPAVGGRGVATLAEALELRDITVERLGEDVMISGRCSPG